MKKILIAIIAVLVLTFGVLWFIVGRHISNPSAWAGAVKQYSRGDTSQEISEYRDHITEALRQGKFELAEQIADEKVAQLTLGETGFERLNSTEAHAQFYSAESVNERVEAVRSLKKLYALAENDIARTRYIEGFFHFMHTAWEPEVISEVFAGEPFGHLRSEEGDMTSIRNLAQYSNSLHPTTSAYFRIANWHIRSIRDFSPWASTPEQKAAAKKHADALISLIEVTNTLHELEMKNRSDAKLGILVRSNYLFWQSTIYSYIAVVYPEYFAQAKQRIFEHEEYYSSTVDEEGKRVDLIAFRLPYAYETYARAQLYANKGREIPPEELEEWKAEIRWALNSLIRHVTNNPEMHKGGIISKLQQMNEEVGTNTYKTVVRLAQLCDPYKQFLQQYIGWSFE